jgi:RHH-type rel operon transcriptional repressor/antitoxin RelB
VCDIVYNYRQSMRQTLSIRIDPVTRKNLEALARRSRRSKSFLAAEAIAAYVKTEEWQLAEIQTGVADLDAGRETDHESVSAWLKSWGKPREKKPPR